MKLPQNVGAVGAQCLQNIKAARGYCWRCAGVRRGRVVIIGGGVVGINAAKMAIGLGARVTMLDVCCPLAYLTMCSERTLIL